MLFDDHIYNIAEKSVLAWLATSDLEGQPNVSPKEIYKLYNPNIILIANIASPGSIKNIQVNPQVSVSILDILVQKGYQLKGRAKIIAKESFAEKTIYQSLLEGIPSKFKVTSIIEVEVKSTKRILAPSYMFDPSTSEEQQIKNAKKQYRLL